MPLIVLFQRIQSVTIFLDKKIQHLLDEINSILHHCIVLVTSLLHTSGFKDTGDYWRSAYESATFQEDLENLLTELKPLYAQLHTYVRNQLRSLYGADKFPRSGHIPAHLLGKQNQVYPLFQNNKHVCLFNLSSVFTIILVNALSPFCQQILNLNFFLRQYVGSTLGQHLRHCDSIQG